MLLSARIIKRPREKRFCDDCGCRINGEQLKLYGMAEDSDKPYNIFLHPFACVSRSPLDNTDILEKLKAVRKATA